MIMREFRSYVNHLSTFTAFVFLGALLLIGCFSDGDSYENLEASSNGRYIDLTYDIKKVKVTSGDMEAFFVKMRTPHITQFECSTCHIEAKITDPEILKNRHADIELTHAASQVMNCLTCHNAGNFDTLITLSGTEIGFDRSFELCGQCHYQKLNDWKYGAHGKRLHNWQGVRVINNCTECHNPHRPEIPKRMPVAFPILRPERPGL